MINVILFYPTILQCLAWRTTKIIHVLTSINKNFHNSEDWNTEVGSQEISRVASKFGLGVQNEAGQRLTEFWQGNTLVIEHPFPTTQEKTLHMDITRWSIPKSDWLYSLKPKIEKLYTVSKNKTRSWLSLTSWTPYCQIQTYIEEIKENH